MRDKQTKEILYRFHKELNRSFESPHMLMAHALELISRYLKPDRLCFFAWDPKESVLSLRMAWIYGVCMEMEEDIDVGESSILRAVVENQKIVPSQTPGCFAIYIPLQWGGDRGKLTRIGSLRLERMRKSRPHSASGKSKARKAGRRHASQDSNHGGSKWTDREKELVLGLAEELAWNLHQVELAQANRRQLKKVTALTELTEVFASSLRVRDGFRLILQGIQKYFGFDRVRLYLVDKQAQKLKGELSADIRGHVKSLAYEEMPLESGSHRFVDIILGKGSDSFIDRYKDWVLYLPLTVQGTSTGLLIVDNLLSQQLIVHDDLMLLKSFAGQIALAVDNARLFDEVQELSLYDELTKLPLRRYFSQRLQEEAYRAERFKQPMALIWMDIDYFKHVNDTFGHQIGDKVLREVGRVVLANLRKIDFPCRYGGDEILVLLPQARAADAMTIADRLNAEVKEIKVAVPFAKVGEVRVNVSQGIATFPDDAGSMDELLQKADEALYWVKSHNKGGTAVYGEVLGKGKESNEKERKERKQ